MISFLALCAVLATASASYFPVVPADTPEVAHAKAQHLAIVEQTKLRNALGVPVVAYAPGYGFYGAPAVVNGHVQDTPEVAAAKAKHLAIQASEAARNNAGYAGYVGYAGYGPFYGAYNPYGYYGGYYGGAPVSVVNGQVQDTPEVAAAKQQHFAAFHAAEARASHGYY